MKSEYLMYQRDFNLRSYGDRGRGWIMRKTKILWLSMYAPISTDSSGGGHTFNYYFTQFLNDDRFDIRLISCGKYKEREVIKKELSSLTHHIIYWGDPNRKKINKLANIESKYSIFNRNAQLISNTEEREIRETLIKYKEEGYVPDVVILEWTNMVIMARVVHELFTTSKLVASEHDVTFVGYQRKAEFYKGLQKIIWNQKYRNEKKVEVDNLKLCDLILPHNADNKKILVENGITESRIIGLIPYYKKMTYLERKSNHRDVLFFGAMSRKENSLSAKWFIENVLPKLSDIDIRFVILGGNPPDFLKKYESDRVHVTGFVDSIDPYFADAMCFVAPLLLGAGIKIKVLEALSSGVPVLTNEIGIEGIPAHNGEEYFHCVSPEDYEQTIRHIYNQNSEEDRMTKKAKDFVEYRFSYDNFSKIYRDKIEMMRLDSK